MAVVSSRGIGPDRRRTKDRRSAYLVREALGGMGRDQQGEVCRSETPGSDYTRDHVKGAAVGGRVNCHFRFWHKADIDPATVDVRYWGVKRTWPLSGLMSANDPGCVKTWSML